MDHRVPQRRRICRRPGTYNYPAKVCVRCGKYAAEDSDTKIQEYIECSLGSCGVCNAEVVQVAALSDFGWPTFYTYENGQPVRS